MHPILQIVLLQNSQCGKELNKFCPPNISDDLRHFFCLYPSFVGSPHRVHSESSAKKLPAVRLILRTIFQLTSDVMRNIKVKCITRWLSLVENYCNHTMLYLSRDSVPLKIPCHTIVWLKLFGYFNSLCGLLFQMTKRDPQLLRIPKGICIFP